MVSLHLKAASDGEIGNEEGDAERRKLWLDDIGALVQRVLGGGEPRLWLITDLSSLEVPADIQEDCFVDLLQDMMRNAKQNGEDGHGMIFLAFLSFTKGTLSLLTCCPLEQRRQRPHNRGSDTKFHKECSILIDR